MLNNDKIRLMTKLALYEQKEGKKNIAGGKYYRSDYVSLAMINSAIIATLAYILILGSIVLVNIETVLSVMTAFDMLELGRIVVVAYIIYMLIYLTITYIISRLRYDNIKSELKSYDNNLKELYTIYKKEEENTQSEIDIKKENFDVSMMEEN
jgi:ASC-1-like (ASCH) protein